MLRIRIRICDVIQFSLPVHLILKHFKQRQQPENLYSRIKHFPFALIINPSYSQAFVHLCKWMQLPGGRGHVGYA